MKYWLIKKTYAVPPKPFTLVQDFVRTPKCAFYLTAYNYIYQMVDEQPDALLVSKNSKEFIAKYYTLAFNAVALDWIHTGMKESPENITQKIEILFSGSLKNALNNM